MPQHSDTTGFLQAVFPDWREHAIFGHSKAAGGMWHARRFEALDAMRDCYWSVASFPDNSHAIRRNERALEVRALVVDDVGTKVDVNRVVIALGPPTAIVETSAGNQQWTYRLSKGVAVADWERVFAGVEGLVGQKLEGRDAVHLFRLPMGLNTKPGRDLFHVKLVSVNPTVTLDVDKIGDNSGPAAASPAAASGPEPRIRNTRKFMALLPNPDVDYDAWIARAHQVKALGLDEVEAFEAFDEWSRKSGKYDTDETARRWATVDPLRTSGLGLLRDVEAADPAGFKSAMADEAGSVFDDGLAPPAVAGGGGYSVTHADMAAEVVRQGRGGLGWMSNSPTRWAGFDPVLGRWVVEGHDKLMRAAVRDEVMACRGRLLALGETKAAKPLADAKWQGSVQGLLVKHSDLMIPFERFDADLMSFGIPGGAVRLGAGGAVEEAGSAGQWISKATSVRPAPAGVKGVAWERFLDDFTMGDRELRLWWQCFLGYCLTGRVDEHMVVFLYGPGGNGKSVFLDTIGEVLGPYHERAASALFMAQQGSKHMAMVADLVGARLVTSPDVPVGASWDLGMIKPLTGGGTFKAQFMRENWFRFTPQFKLILAGNEKPGLAAVDAAVRRRFWLVPAMFVPRRVNKQLVDVLRGEKAEILRWMIAGWEAYNLGGGLPSCKLIERETEEYLAGQDTFGKWVGSISRAPGDKTRHRITDLWNSWDAFRASEGSWKASPINKQALATKLKEAGFSVDRDNQGAYVDQIVVVKTPDVF